MAECSCCGKTYTNNTVWEAYWERQSDGLVTTVEEMADGQKSVVVRRQSDGSIDTQKEETGRS